MTDIRVDIPQDFDETGHEALMNILWTGTLLKKASRRFFRDTEFSEAEFNLLIVLSYSDEPLSQVDVSERMLVDKSNVTSLIDRLETAGLIERKPVPEDRRRYHIHLTREGKRRIDAVDPVYHGLVREVMSGLTEREHQTIIRLTRKVREGLAKHF
ncbi:MAG: MarR family transcriptional regulator [Candidatus Eisenbacteria bacterium]|uniref:MarR family transcriptional regulator n=1 Tax=Eiseniibacteriota bacterium TaxID=2212470 RepID=A0A956SCG2_UNCEI|nr:MarR family transcriptional regulator [Candidatus Eisenbacteria bacterium]MCB9466110.1 MarR family transcriptional regulator [Candidatus Eisenbacteria bacterium]